MSYNQSHFKFSDKPPLKKRKTSSNITERQELERLRRTDAFFLMQPPIVGLLARSVSSFG